MHIRKARHIYFLPPNLLPPGFQYPESYRTFVATSPSCIGASNEDWCILDEEDVEPFLDYARKIAPDRPLVPFMRRNGEDGVACFDGASKGVEPTVYVFNYSVDVGYGGGNLLFADWLATIPPYDEDEE
jgi:hypothetical protein